MTEKIPNLADGLDEGQYRELQGLDALEAALKAYEAPGPDSVQTARLLATLEEHLPPHPALDSPEQRLGANGFLRLAASQARLFEKPFWFAALGLLVLGLFISWLSEFQSLPALAIFLAPLLAAGFVAYAFRPESTALWELEKSAVSNPLALFYARACLCIALAGVCILVLLAAAWFFGPPVVLWRALLSWAGPMLALSGVALFSAVRWNTVAGLLVPLGAWGVWAISGWRMAAKAALESGMQVDSWVLLQINASNAWLAASLLLCAAGLVLIGLSGRRLSGKRSGWV
jgi:hypothetical protein